MSIRVLLVDDQPLLRLGFQMVLDSQPDLDVVGQAGDGAEGVALTAELDPDVVLMDVRMPGVDGIEATQLIIESGSPTRVLVLTTFDLDEYVYAALRSGASGFLLKDVSPQDLASAIRAVILSLCSMHISQRFPPSGSGSKPLTLWIHLSGRYGGAHMAT